MRVKLSGRTLAAMSGAPRFAVLSQDGATTNEWRRAANEAPRTRRGLGYEVVFEVGAEAAVDLLAAIDRTCRVLNPLYSDSDRGERAALRRDWKRLRDALGEGEGDGLRRAGGAGNAD